MRLNKDKIIGIRFNLKQVRQITKLAKKNNLFVGEWIRSLVEKEIEESEKK
jgi:hypothetical protein